MSTFRKAQALALGLLAGVGLCGTGFAKDDAARLKAGANTITFTRAAAQGNNTGLGYDCIKLQVA